MALAIRQGLRPAQPDRSDEPDISVALGDEPPEVTGPWTNHGPVITGGLPADWTETVADPGHALLDDHVIVQIQVADKAARPNRVRAVRLVAEG